MNELKAFNHPMFGELHVLVKNGKELFPAADVANKLGYSNPHDAINKHCRSEGIAFHEVLSNGGPQQKKFISEGNLYRLIAKSKLPSAEKFESWVFDEVLPSIRKHGAYMTENTLEKALTSPDFLIQLATQLKEEQSKRFVAEQTIQKQQPLVSFAESCMASDRSLLVRELAKLVSKQGILIGERRLYQKLRDWRLIFLAKNEPYQEYIDRGYFEVSQGVKENEKGSFTWLTTRITPKGQAYIINRLKKEQQDVAI
jgi:anti-repressor protein